MGKKKYELVPSDKEGLFRIKALRNFGDVKKGDIGGYVSGEHNLSHEGLCWIFGNAKVYGNAEVSGNAWVSDNAKVYDDASVINYARVSGNAIIYGKALVYDIATIYGNAVVCGDAEVHGNAVVRGKAKVCGYANIGRNAEICRNAVINKITDYKVFLNTWSDGCYFTWTRSNNMWKVGCFYGSGEKLIKKAYKDSKLNGKMYEIHVNFVNEMLKAEQELTESE